MVRGDGESQWHLWHSETGPTGKRQFAGYPVSRAALLISLGPTWYRRRMYTSPAQQDERLGNSPPPAPPREQEGTDGRLLRGIPRTEWLVRKISMPMIRALGHTPPGQFDFHHSGYYHRCSRRFFLVLPTGSGTKGTDRSRSMGLCGRLQHLQRNPGFGRSGNARKALRGMDR
jgi:hypothetical protein